jgi:FkbM family methyltransferase
MVRYLKFFNYYLEVFSKKLIGKLVDDPNKNGEYAVLDSIIKMRKNKGKFCFIDGGSNLGSHVLTANKLCKKYNVISNIFAIECNPPTIKLLKRNLKNINYSLITDSLGDKEKKISFFYNSKYTTSGQNSGIKHYYFNSKRTVKQITLDSLLKKKNITHVDFLKLDIEGAEYNALKGMQKSLKNKIINYIQLEYNQTWIAGGGTIEKIFNIAKKYGYNLFRIRRYDLLSIPQYHFILDDFCYSNLLLVRKNCDLPLICHKTAIPLFI